MAESSSTSVFESDPTLIAPSQRVAQAHAAHNGEKSNPDPLEFSDDEDDPFADEPPAKIADDEPKEVNLADESLFPTLGGGSKTVPSKSLWGNARASNVIPIASQVVSATDLVTESVKLEASQQQPRSLGKNTTGDTVKRLQKETGTSIQMSTAQKTGTTVFLIKGKPEAVANARRSLMKELGKKVSFIASQTLSCCFSLIHDF